MQILAWELKQEKYHRSVKMGALSSFCFTCVAIVPSSSQQRKYKALSQGKGKKPTESEVGGFFKQRKDSLQMWGRTFLHVKTRHFNGKDASLGFYAAELCRTGKLYKNEGFYPKGISALW